MRRPAMNRLAVESNRAALWLQQPGDRAERRRFAGPVRADQRDDFAFLDAQRHAPQSLDRSVEHAQVFDAQ